MEGFPEYLISGGIDWFEWWAVVHWEATDRTARVFAQLQAAKEQCQHLRKPYLELFIDDFGPVRVKRVGFNRGGDRGQHFEYALQIAGVSIGVSPRTVDSSLQGIALRKALPSFVAKQSGRDCLLTGATEGYETACALLSALGGMPVIKRISRADLCLDISNLDVSILLGLVKLRHFITRAYRVRPEHDLVFDRETGFSAGKNPAYLTVYDKVREQFGNYDRLYYQALVDRRWGGVAREMATRIEFQLCRRWLRQYSVETPEDFLALRGRIWEKLTHEWFRITEQPVDPKSKHQSRATTHPLWEGIQQGGLAIFGQPEGQLVPIKRCNIEPIELARQARGCLANCFLQRGTSFRNYREFVNACAHLLLWIFPTAEERSQFMEELEKRRMDFEAS